MVWKGDRVPCVGSAIPQSFVLYAQSRWQSCSQGRHLDDVRAGRCHDAGSTVWEAVAAVLGRAPRVGRLDADDRRGDLLLFAVAAVHLVGLHVEIRATRRWKGHTEDFSVTQDNGFTKSRSTASNTITEHLNGMESREQPDKGTESGLLFE